MKIASRTQRQLNSNGSNVRHQDHQVHRPKNTKKYTDEVKDGNIIPEEEEISSRLTAQNWKSIYHSGNVRKGKAFTTQEIMYISFVCFQGWIKLSKYEPHFIYKIRTYAIFVVKQIQT